MGPLVALRERRGAELGEQEGAEQGPGPAGEPPVDRDHRPVVLLDLLLFERQLGDERDVEGALDSQSPVLGAGAPRLGTER